MIAAAKLLLAFGLCGSFTLTAQNAGAEPAPGTEVDFARHILPILRTKCFDCHSATKRDGTPRDEPKGGLRLDGRVWIERGGDGEDAVVPGSLEESAIYTRTALPPDDPDFMPSKGEALDRAELEQLRTWIAAGADFGEWVGVAPPEGQPSSRPTKNRPVHETARARLLRELERSLTDDGRAPLDQLPSDVVARAQIVPVLADSRLLRVSFRSYEGLTDDATVRALSPIAPWIAVLDLGRTRVTDRSVRRHLATMSNLVRLDLSKTEVGDAAAKSLGSLLQLRQVNLYGTKLTDAGLAALAAAPRLQRVYAWQTGVTADGVEAAAPLEVIYAPSWPR